MPRTPEAAKAVADAAMALVALGDVRAAIVSLLPVWPMPESELEALVASTLEQRGRLAARFGGATGTQFVGKRLVAGTLLRLVYLEKFENHALRWIFTFYRPAKEWRLNSFHWDDKLAELLDSAR
ncbi:MAG TPA: hypothetical protein VLV90_00235 [Burkholderiales bacterium]|nr:hypothetical protein [Burkholderiales bacterium]